MQKLRVCALTLALTASAMLIGCRSVRETEPQTQWGAVEEGLRAGVRPSTEETIPGEGVEFTFYLTNASGSPKTVVRPDAGTLTWYFNGHMIAARPGRPDRTVVLQPGDSVEYVVRHAWETPGTYVVRAELHARTEALAGQEVKSGEAIVTVTE